MMEGSDDLSGLKFRPITDKQGLKDIFPVMAVLRPQYNEDEFVHFALSLLIPAGANIIAGYHNDNILSAAVFRIGHSLAWGKYLYIDDLVTSQENRSRGCGSALLQHIAEIGKDAGCQELHLDSGVQRHEAHRFYLRERMDIVFYHFRSELT